MTVVGGFSERPEELVKLDFCSFAGGFRLVCWEEFSNEPLPQSSVTQVSCVELPLCLMGAGTCNNPCNPHSSLKKMLSVSPFFV